MPKLDSSVLFIFSEKDDFHSIFRFLPNHCAIIERFRSKAFCGTYSFDGSVFMSACQGLF